MKIIARFYLILLLAALLLAGYFHYSLITFEEKCLKNTLLGKTTTAEKTFDFFLKNAANQMDAIAKTIPKDKTTMAFFSERLRSALYAHILGFYEENKKNLDISHLYFIEPDGTILLRTHRRDTYGDKALHSIFQSAQKTHTTTAGFGLGKTSLALRVASPILAEGKLVGFLELGIEAASLLKRLALVTQENYILLLQRNYLSTENWLLLKESFQSRGLGESFGNQIVLSSSFSLKETNFKFPDETTSILEKPGEIKIFQSGNQYLALSSFPLLDSEKNRIGTILTVFNLTKTISENRKLLSVKLFVTLGLLILMSVIYFFWGYTFLNSIKKIKEALQKIIRGEFELTLEGIQRDELGDLAGLVNQTAQSFQSTLQEIRAYMKRLEAESSVRTKELILTRSDLEKKVQERTTELTKSQTAMLYMIEDLNRQAEEIRRAQEKIVRSEKLAAIGQLSSSVAHELRNPLGVMKNAIYYLNMLKLGENNPDIQQNLNIISQEIENSNKIIGDLLEFSRIKKPTLRMENLHEILKETLKRISISPSVQLQTEWDESIPLLSADALQLQQVFYNLILNAIQAMEEGGGTLKITTRKKDGFAEIIFEDSGSGISKELLGKVFEPLFSTKAKGTGLGLPVCASLITGHHGKIEVESELGKGTAFVVKLPLAAEKK